MEEEVQLWRGKKGAGAKGIASSTAAMAATRGETRMDETRLLITPMSGPAGISRSLDSIDVNSVMMGQRIVFLGSEVDDVSADWIVSQLLLLDAQDPTKDIKLFINSPGGSITAGMAIYDAMRLCRADVSTVCFGLAASMGAFLLCAGTKGKRYAMPNARIMIHQPLGGAQGAAIDVALQVREMIYHKLKLNRIMAYLTGKTEEQIEKDTDRDYFMTSWEAKEYGLIDHVVDDGKPGLVAPMGEVQERKASEWEYFKVREGKARRDLPSEVKLMPTK
eukprot:TRINITY_DN13640_c1_g1_i2.p1 TRINITY_DN13640_c1_g1~~TRINITY_DN13640_c1_g1_i2.p1  ORF type:complete len:277 (+),score=47.15 TRINITY_DN13640_c1_g1_i2:156-986(+)